MVRSLLDTLADLLLPPWLLARLESHALYVQVVTQMRAKLGAGVSMGIVCGLVLW